jgi:transposase
VDRRGRAARLHDLGWSNKQIARQLGVHPSTIGRWLTASQPSGDALPTDDTTPGDAVSDTNTTGDMSDQFTDDTKEQS